jgi:predicted transposase/invertase (TIGR01784 family)
MFSLSDLRETRVYQEALEEGIEQGIEQGELMAKLRSIPRLVALGLSVEQIAQALELDIERVKEAIAQE